jgi:hypothetical protein
MWQGFRGSTLGLGVAQKNLTVGRATCPIDPNAMAVTFSEMFASSHRSYRTTVQTFGTIGDTYA